MMTTASDEFVCRTCSDKCTFSKIYEYLIHKTLHLQEEAPNICGMYMCHLCPQHCSRRSALLMHYTLYHKIHGLSKSNCCRENTTLKPRKRSIDKKSVRLHTTLKSVSKLSAITDNGDSFLEQFALGDSLTRVSNTLFGCFPKESGGVGNDFHFTLQNETVRGASLKYLKSVLACIYCPYQCSVLPELTNHMQQLHPTVLNQPIHSQQIPTDKNGILRLSEYVQRTSALLVSSGADASPSVKGPQTMPFRCEFCSKHFTNKNYLDRHINKQHIEPKVFKCDLCDHTETAKHKLSIHRRKHLVKEFRCKECDFISTVKIAIQSHRQIHSCGSYICEICKNAYESKDTLQKHKRVHDALRPFSCTVTGCTLRFKTDRMYRGHLKTHFGDGNSFPCTECGYTFRHKHHLKRHLESVHNIPCAKSRRQGKGTDQMTVYGIPDVGTNDSEVATFNLKNIILGEETFELATQADECDNSSISLMKPNKGSNTSYREIIDTESNQQTGFDSPLASVYITEQSNNTNCENSLPQDDTDTRVSNNSAYCLSQSANGTIAVREIQSITTSSAGYTADDDSVACDTVFEYVKIPSTSDSLFSE